MEKAVAGLIGIPKYDPKGHKKTMHEGAIRVAAELGCEPVEGRSEDLLMDLKKGRLDYVVCGADKLGMISTPDFGNRWRASGLDFGYCRLALMGKPGNKPANLLPTHEELTLQAPKLQVPALRIVTSYPELLAAWAKTVFPLRPYVVEERTGGCEVAVARDWADAAFDIIDTGSTLRRYGLEVWVDDCLTLNAVLVNLLRS